MSVWHLIDYVWINYFWSSLKGNGPEALVQTVVYGMIALAVYPPLRKWAKRETAHLHAKVDHLAKHLSEVPAFDDRKHGFEPKDTRPLEPK